MEWSTDTKNGYDDLEVYLEYGYVFVSTTGRNHAKMAYCLFTQSSIKPPLKLNGRLANLESTCSLKETTGH